MHAVWFENRQFSLRTDSCTPSLQKGDALVRIITSAICGTDLELQKGNYPFVGIPGHEFVGIVEQAPSCTHLIGKRVVGEITIACGNCMHCRHQRKKHCENRSVLGLIEKNGTFAEYCAIPCDNLVVVPDTLPDHIAVFSEPAAAALQVVEQVTMTPSDHVLIIGAGRLGQLVARAINLVGCDLTVVARHTRQRQRLEDVGIAWINETALPQKAFDIVVDATGCAEGMSVAVAAVRAGGTIVMKSTYAGHVGVDLSSLVVNEVSLIGSRCGPVDKAVKTLTDGLIDPSPLIDGVFALTHALKALQLAGEPGRLKVLLQCAKS